MSVGVASVPEIASPVDSLCVRLDGMLLELAEAVAGCVELRDVRGVTDRERIDRIARLEQLKAAAAALQAAESVRFAQSQVELQIAADVHPKVIGRGCQVVCVNTSEEVSTDDGCHDESARTAGVGAPGRVCAGRGGQAGPGRFAGRVDGPGRRGFVAVDWGGRVSAGAGETGAGSRPGCGAE